jgi:hypothetical protein
MIKCELYTIHTALFLIFKLCTRMYSKLFTNGWPKLKSEAMSTPLINEMNMLS